MIDSRINKIVPFGAHFFDGFSTFALKASFERPIVKFFFHFFQTRTDALWAFCWVWQLFCVGFLLFIFRVVQGICCDVVCHHFVKVVRKIANGVALLLLVAINGGNTQVAWRALYLTLFEIRIFQNILASQFERFSLLVFAWKRCVAKRDVVDSLEVRLLYVRLRKRQDFPKRPAANAIRNQNHCVAYNQIFWIWRLVNCCGHWRNWAGNDKKGN